MPTIMQRGLAFDSFNCGSYRRNIGFSPHKAPYKTRCTQNSISWACPNGLTCGLLRAVPYYVGLFPGDFRLGSFTPVWDMAIWKKCERQEFRNSDPKLVSQFRCKQTLVNAYSCHSQPVITQHMTCTWNQKPEIHSYQLNCALLGFQWWTGYFWSKVEYFCQVFVIVIGIDIHNHKIEHQAAFRPYLQVFTGFFGLSGSSRSWSNPVNSL